MAVVLDIDQQLNAFTNSLVQAQPVTQGHGRDGARYAGGAAAEVRLKHVGGNAAAGLARTPRQQTLQPHQ
eukprot:6191666-Pleurochrysis_carterae.AAC.1